MLNTVKTAFVLILTGFLLAACQTPGPKQSFADITFAHLAPINMKVSKVEVVNDYKAQNDGHHVEDRFPVSPAKALEQWVTDRIKPVGGPDSGVLRLVITDGGVLETKLKKDKSITGTFTKQQTHRYNLTAGGRLEIYDSAGNRQGYSAAKATRTTTTREDVTLNEREEAWFKVTEKLLADFNQVMEDNIQEHLGKWMQ
jgi:hypothetical protein